MHDLSRGQCMGMVFKSKCSEYNQNAQCALLQFPLTHMRILVNNFPWSNHSFMLWSKKGTDYHYLGMA